MAFTEETKLAEIEILDSGRVQFREETQIYRDGVPMGSPTYHRSGVDPGFLDEFENLIPFPLPTEPETKGLKTDIDLEALLTAVRTPQVMDRWRQKLIADQLERVEKEKIAESHRIELEKAQAAAEEADKKRLAEAVATAMQKHAPTP